MIEIKLIGNLLIAGLLSLLLYAVFRKKGEFSRLALRNTGATIAIVGANVYAAIYFIEPVNRFAQSAYATLHIPTLDPQIWQGLPLWLTVIVAIVSKDFADYWNHRLMHTRWGWPSHAAHHSDTHVNAFTTYRVHFLEATLMSLSYVVLLTWMQLPETIPIVVTIGILHNMYVHLDLDWGHGPLRYVLASPRFHRWHHADVPEAYGKNLANVIPLYDVLFGTYYNPRVCDAPMGAKTAGIEDVNPLLIYLYPFQAWGRLIAKAWRGRRRAPGHAQNLRRGEAN